jgi:cytochrome P450/NADPH-cytochrome P450 reductase
MGSTPETVPIPGPKGLPFVGSMLDVNIELPLSTWDGFADEYGKLLPLTQCKLTRLTLFQGIYFVSTFLGAQPSGW